MMQRTGNEYLSLMERLQYFDVETGFHYNDYRTYDPSTAADEEPVFGFRIPDSQFSKLSPE